MAFGELGLSKVIAMNAPKYSRIVEPFADGGTVAMYPGMKKPKEHIVNIEDEKIFGVMLFMQTFSVTDKKNLKGRDWVASPEAFDAALATTATEGADLYYQFFYLKKFGIRSKDPEIPPTFNFLKLGLNISSLLFTLPMAKIGLKKATLTNEEPLSVFRGSGGSETFVVLVPKKPEHIEAVEAGLSGLGAQFFYAKKIKDPNDLIESANNSGDLIISLFTAATIKMTTMEVRTNYEHKSREKLKILEPIEGA